MFFFFTSTIFLKDKSISLQIGHITSNFGLKNLFLLSLNSTHVLFLLLLCKIEIDEQINLIVMCVVVCMRNSDFMLINLERITKHNKKLAIYIENIQNPMLFTYYLVFAKRTFCLPSHFLEF